MASVYKNKYTIKGAMTVKRSLDPFFGENLVKKLSFFFFYHISDLMHFVSLQSMSALVGSI